MEEPTSLRLVATSPSLCEERCVEGIYLNGVELDPCFLKRLHNQLQVGPLTWDALESLRSMIVRDYVERGYPFVVVTIPEQEVEGGIIQIHVTESCCGQIAYEGNCYFSDLSFGCATGDPLYLPALLDELAWLNRNPFRRIDVVFTPGVVSGSTDLILQTTERDPLIVFGGIDNTGTRTTGSERLSAGFRYGMPWDHVLTYQFTSAASLRKFQSHNVDYLMPLPWRHTLDLFGGWVTTEPNVGKDLKCTGTSWQICGRYEMPWNLQADRLQNVVLGVDFKRTNNDLAFGGETIIHHLLDSAQFMCGSNIAKIDDSYQWMLNTEIYFSPGHLTPHDTTKLYKQLRPGAKAAYAYAWADLSAAYTLPSCMEVTFNGAAQGSTTNLLPAEQLELAGYYAVRGYPEHEINVDNGVFFNLELHSSSYAFFSCDRLFGLLFFDYGYGCSHTHFQGEPKNYELISIGPGLRYNVSSNLAFRLDFGWQLKSARPHQDRSCRLHAGLFLDF